MTYAEAIQFLYELRLFGAKLELENTRKLAGLVGNPQDSLRFIHVAGTNGKGSTCAILESIYRAAGLRVGLFTSPHLISFRERIQIDRQLITESDVIRLVAGIKEKLAHFSADQSPTFFEALTVMALQYFAEQKCDIVIWETGLGGRLDATNIVTPLASVITNIALDHQQWLGDTLEKIAVEKAGIIKPRIPVITSALDSGALSVIEKTARQNHSPLSRISVPNPQFPAPAMSGHHQKMNAALAIATVETLQSAMPVSREAIDTGLRTVNWPGRFQLFTGAHGRKIILDGAHNIAGAQTLAHTLRELFPDPKPCLILGMLQDKDWQEMCEILCPLASQVLFVPVQSDRTALPHDLMAEAKIKFPEKDISSCSSLADGLETTRSAPLTVIAGSLYLIGEALELLVHPKNAGSERALNEWNPQNTHKLR